MQQDPTLPKGYENFLKVFQKRSGLDLTAYKNRQMIRRLKSYLNRVKLSNFEELSLLLLESDEALQHLKDFVTINVSEFFRNRERFEHLSSHVLPELIGRFGTLRIWSAGCSIGAEPYSLAILLEELDPKGRHRILATDVDQTVLKQAAEGVFGEDKLKEVSRERLQHHFQAVGDNTWKIVPRIRRWVDFRHHNLLKDRYPSNVHLILCRNVVIYFNDEAKNAIYRGFAQSLVPGGYLLVGNTESIFAPHQYGLRSAGHFLYQTILPALHRS